MHTLPFGASITERLFQMVREAGAEYDGRRLAEFAWVQEPPSGRWLWLLLFKNKEVVPFERVFVVDGLPIYIAQNAEELLRGRVVDWSEKVGLMTHESVA